MADLLSEIRFSIDKSLELFKSGQLQEALTIARSCRTYVDTDVNFTPDAFESQSADHTKAVYGQSFTLHDHSGLRAASTQLYEVLLQLRVVRILLLMRAQPSIDSSILTSIACELQHAMTDLGSLLCQFDAVLSNLPTFELAISSADDARRYSLLRRGIQAAIRNGDEALAQKWTDQVKATDTHAQIRESLKKDGLGSAGYRNRDST